MPKGQLIFIDFSNLLSFFGQSTVQNGVPRVSLIFWQNILRQYISKYPRKFSDNICT